MTTLAPNLPPLPDRFKKLPLDARGYPIPKFVHTIDGKPDFRVVRPGWIARCYNGRLCWLCGEKLGLMLAFVIGPMCVINRTTSEPPSHLDCAEYATRACPFMLFPNRKRDPHGLPENKIEPAGIHLDRNPGCFCIYVTQNYSPIGAPGGTLFRLGHPDSVAWRCQGRDATREEVEASIAGGYPHLRKLAEQDGPDAIMELQRMTLVASRLLPPTQAELDDLERRAATLWRSENPDQSVFDCSEETKRRYRSRVTIEQGFRKA